MNLSLTSGLAQDMKAMLEFRMSLGYSGDSYIYHFKSLDRFCNENYPSATELNEDIVLGWLQIKPGNVNVLHQRASSVRMLGKYIASTGKNAYILPNKFIPPQKVYTPYILSDKELKALFSAIDAYPVNPRLDALQPALFSTLFRLIYTCGLRPHEGRTLLVRNVNLETGEIFIASAKKHKDRIVVLSDDMRALMIRYANKKALVHPDSPYFFPCKKGIPYTENMLSWHFKNFVAAANPGIEREKLPNVRIYDLRHRFATTVMMKWIDEQRNMYNMLPYLSTYMGHAKFAQTAYYIQLIPENIKNSGGIDWAAMGSLIPEVQQWEE